MLPQSSKNGKNIHVNLQVGQRFMTAILDFSLEGPLGHLTPGRIIRELHVCDCTQLFFYTDDVEVSRTAISNRIHFPPESMMTMHCQDVFEVSI